MSSSAFLAAMGSRDREALLAALSPSYSGKANGRTMDREAQVRLVESFWTGFPDGTFTLEATGGHGHQVITWTFAGTHGGSYLGVPATGTKVALSGFIIALSDESGVRSLDWKWDTKAFARQVLGPEDIEDAPKPPGHRPDPSVRWAREAQRRGGGGRQPKRKRKPQGRASTPARTAQAEGDGSAAPAAAQPPAPEGQTPPEPPAPASPPEGDPTQA